MNARRALPLLHAIVIALAGACAPDPVHDRAVERLGGETARGPDEFHRPGQPCATCHNAKSGPAHSDFSAAGTIFEAHGSLAGVDGVRVDLVDSAGTSPTPVGTNCVGNFWILRSKWDPVLPIVSVRLTKGAVTREMKSPIGGTASCADCHQPAVIAANPLAKLGAVYLLDAPPPPSGPSTCPVDPVLVTP